MIEIIDKMQVGKLQVLKGVYEEDKNGDCLVDCVCECGKKIKKYVSYLKNDKIVQSCGCYVEAKHKVKTEMYLIKCKCGEHVFYKIDVSKNVDARLVEIQNSNPFLVKLIAKKSGNRRHKAKLCAKYDDWKYRRGWFKFDSDILGRVMKEF